MKHPKIQYKIRIEGKFKGVEFTYDDPDNDKGNGFYDVIDNDPNAWWWSEGNMGCDCNRYQFLPPELKLLIEKDEYGDDKCGDEILIKRIIPLEYTDTIPILELNEY